MNDTYTHGHQESVLRNHRWRTAENSAAYLLPHLTPTMSLLDVGCGPGTITADFAKILSNGRVVGLDSADSVIAEASGQSDLPSNCTFVTGDVYALQFDDSTFDVIHAHQVLQHLVDPVAALREIYRVLKPGGIIALRECDYQAFLWAPADPVLSRWLELYHAVAKRNGAEPDAGRYMLTWAHAAGLSNIRLSGSLWFFADDASRAWWGGSWAERVESSSFATQAMNYQLTTTTELGEIALAWKRWLSDPDATFGVPNVEVLATK